MEKIETPESSNIAWFGYNASTATLTVAFKSGKQFHYKHVPHARFAEMKDSPSRGSYFARHIKGHYDAEIQEDVF